MSTNVTGIEKSNDFISKECEDTKEKLKSADEDLIRLNKKCKDFEDKVKTLETQNQTIESKTGGLEAISMRENVLFHGIPEANNENCEVLVKQFVAEKLNIVQDITLDRAHRLGKPRGNNGRKLLTLCKSTDHIIANGRLFYDQDGEFTFCCQRGLSVTDYRLLHVVDINALKHFEVLD